MTPLVTNQRGQTSLEYLLLLSVAFITSYIMITGPLATFTQLTLVTIRSALGNVIRNGEMKPGTVAEPGEDGHPSNPARLKPLHLGG